MIKLRVQWPNAGHELLSEPELKLRADEAELAPVSVAEGAHDFEVPDDARVVELDIAFSRILPVLSGYTGQPTQRFTLLQAAQSWFVEGGALVPRDAILFNSNTGETEIRTVHPLVQSASQANAISGAAVVVVRTEFLDMTAQFLRNIARYDRVVFDNDVDPAGDFVALAATVGAPPLWFAHFPKKLDPPAPETGMFVFYRPDAHYQYKTAFDVAHRKQGGANLFRYLLAPKNNGPFEFKGQSFDDKMRYPFADPAFALRVGMEQSVLRSGKPIVTVLPWASVLTECGDALTSLLPTRLEQILAFLHGTARIGASHQSLSLGRLAIGGYSAGGVAVGKALKTNAAHVKELYLFDPFKFAEVRAHAAHWALTTADFRLRMTGANFRDQMRMLQLAVIAGVSGEAGDAFVSLRPERADAIGTDVNRMSEYWRYVTHKIPNARFSFEVTHQFAMFGGDQIEVAPDKSMVSNLTWLDEFLITSGF